MGQVVRGKPDPALAGILDILKQYEAAHPAAEVSVYRQNSVSVRIRIIDPDFKDHSRSERHEIVWRSLEQLPEEIVSDVTILVLLTPDEVSESLANFDFEHPIPSRL
jgi:acid stress-induced BolA-like protein IbaG/YrbA